MWNVDDQMPTFKALSYREKLRVGRIVARGEAPRDPRMALAAVELAESYQRQEKFELTFMRWGPPILIFIASVALVFAAIDGDKLGLTIYTMTLLLTTWQLACSPATRPKNTARSLEASRRVAAGAEA